MRLAIALACLAAPPAIAQGVDGGSPDLATTPPVAESPAAIEARRALRGEELERIRGEIAVTDQRKREIAAEIATIEKDRAALSAELVTAAARVQDFEGKLSASEARLTDLAADETDIRTRLAAREAILADVLAAAQRIGRRPPPALIVQPQDALGAVRSAIVLGAVLPEIRVEAEALSADLEALVAVRSEVATERDRLKADATSIEEAKVRLALLIEEKKKLGETRNADLAAAEARAVALAGEAKSLEELMVALDAALDAARNAPEVAALGPDEAVPPRIGGDGRLKPAMPFEAAKGLVPLPVRGVMLKDFGDDNGFGGRTDGIYMATRANARVTAPVDGEIVFAADFRTYGQLLILDAGDGYHIVLSGMERIDVELNQFVLAGEPIGTMGSRRLASLVMPDISLSQPVLYIEFRKDRMSIDPTPWWIDSQDRKARG